MLVHLLMVSFWSRCSRPSHQVIPHLFVSILNHTYSCTMFATPQPASILVNVVIIRFPMKTMFARIKIEGGIIAVKVTSPHIVWCMIVRTKSHLLTIRQYPIFIRSTSASAAFGRNVPHINTKHSNNIYPNKICSRYISPAERMYGSSFLFIGVRWFDLIFRMHLRRFPVAQPISFVESIFIVMQSYWTTASCSSWYTICISSQKVMSSVRYAYAEIVPNCPELSAFHPHPWRAFVLFTIYAFTECGVPISQLSPTMYLRHANK